MKPSITPESIQRPLNIQMLSDSTHLPGMAYPQQNHCLPRRNGPRRTCKVVHPRCYPHRSVQRGTARRLHLPSHADSKTLAHTCRALCPPSQQTSKSPRGTLAPQSRRENRRRRRSRRQDGMAAYLQCRPGSKSPMDRRCHCSPETRTGRSFQDLPRRAPCLMRPPRTST